MAQAQKNIEPPRVEIPQALSLFVEGFKAKSELDANVLFVKAITSISSSSKLTKQDLQRAYTLFSMINPQDDFERVWCAQFIVGHLLGMHSIALPSPKDKRIGLKLLKAADDALERIHKKRGTSSNNPINQGVTDGS